MQTGFSGNRERLLPLDALRGLIMVLMAIDHASYFVARVHRSESWSNPLPQYADALSFFTRFITHLCAPGFFFLMGLGMMLFAESRRRNGWPETRIALHFALRGFILILMQFLAENMAWSIADGWSGIIVPYFGVLYALGSVMIVWSLMLRLPSSIIASISILAIAGTQFLISSLGGGSTQYSPILRLILIPGTTGSIYVLYPVIPWFGVTGLGLLFARKLLKDRDQAYRLIAVSGAMLLFLFVVVRMIGGFGDFHTPVDWKWMSLLNVTKYPPSFAFLLVTLGIDFVILAIFALSGDRLIKWGFPLLVFGRTALFFYIAHLYLYGIMGLAFPHGIPLPKMYAFWLLGLLVLYPMCLWYGNMKQKTAPNSILRFF